MTPTRAQIDAAKEQYKKAYDNLGGVGFACFLTSKEQDDAFKSAFERLAIAAQSYVPLLEAQAALTAAAEVGRPGGDRWQDGYEAGMKSAAPAIYVLQAHNKTLEATTIERCAQVADRFACGVCGIGDQCAAAIRDLKEKL